jgi:hypothetical protein
MLPKILILRRKGVLCRFYPGNPTGMNVSNTVGMSVLHLGRGVIADVAQPRESLYYFADSPASMISSTHLISHITIQKCWLRVGENNIIQICEAANHQSPIVSIMLTI